MNWIALLVWNVAEIVDRLADNIHHATEGALAHGHGDWPTRVGRFHSAHHAVGRQHRNGAHAAFTQMLLHFGNHVDRFGHLETIGSNSQRLIDRRQIFLSELGVDHRANNLHDFPDVSVRAISVRRSHIFPAQLLLIIPKPYRRKLGRILKREKITYDSRAHKASPKADHSKPLIEFTSPACSLIVWSSMKL